MPSFDDDSFAMESTARARINVPELESESTLTPLSLASKVCPAAMTDVNPFSLITSKRSLFNEIISKPSTFSAKPAVPWIVAPNLSVRISNSSLTVCFWMSNINLP